MKINREKTIFDVLYSKQAFLNNKNIGVKNAQNWHFCKRVSPWFFFKNWKFCERFVLCKIHPEKVFVDVLVRKRAFLDNINMDLKRRQNSHFCKGDQIVHDFGLKVEVFSSFVFIKNRFEKKCLMTF